MKRSRIIPLALLVYLIVISIYAYPGRNHKLNITWEQYGLTIGITLVCIIVLSYLLKKRDKTRDDMKKK